MSSVDRRQGGCEPRRSRRVLYVLKRFPRLSETFVLRELLGLEAAGLGIGVDALRRPETGPRHSELTALRGRVRCLADEVGRGHRAIVEAVAERASREGFDHLHAHFATAAAEVARDAARLAGIPFTVTAHAKDIFHRDNAPLLRARLAGAKAVVTVSAYNVEHLRQVLGAGVDVRLVRNGFALGDRDRDGHGDRDGDENGRGNVHGDVHGDGAGADGQACGGRKLGPAVGGPVLCVARLVAKKGVDTLLEAAALCPPQRRFEVVGGGELGEELVGLAHRLGVAGRVAFRGPQPSDMVDAAYRAASMVVAPCRIAASGDRDGLPTVLVEAMARGLPVVSTDVVGITELVRHGRTGLVVPPDDPAALAAAIETLAADPAAAARLGAAGRGLVASDYDPQRATAALAEVFS